MKKLLFLFMLCFVSISMMGQTITGKVTDAKTGDALPGVTVMIPAVSVATTDSEGSYSLDVKDLNVTITFSLMGYKELSLPANGKAELNAQLEIDEQFLDEAVVVGYGVQRKGEITSAITSMKSEDFNQTPVVSPIQLLEGRVAGLTISRASTDPSGDVYVQMRGVSSLKGDVTPLIIIDGIPGSMSTLNAISPDDIEAMDILKDGSAAAIYGTRGNNGVIIVTTKRPTAGRSTVEYSAYLSHEAVSNRPDILSAEEFLAYGAKSGSTTIKDLGGRDDVYGLLLNKGNFTHSHNLSFSGGVGGLSARASLTYRDQEGMAILGGKETISGSVAVNQRALKDKLLLSLNLSASFVDSDITPDRGGIFYEAIRRNPTTPIYNADGTYYENYSSWDDFNPVARANQRFEHRENKDILGSFKATYEIIPGLSTSAFVALEKRDYITNDYHSIDELGSVKGVAPGWAQKNYEKTDNRTFEWTADYNASIGGVHNINALLGYSYQDFEWEKMRMANSKFLTDAFGTNNMEAGAYLKEGLADMETDKRTHKLIAFFARVNYNYDGKYMFSASIRREGSSKFGASNKWAWFPSVSAGWMITNEQFMQNQQVVDMLKFRVGFGITGSLPNDPYMSLTKYGVPDWYGDIWGYYDGTTDSFGAATYGPLNNPNEDLRWEKNQSLNIGIDFALFDNLLTGSIDWYQRDTKDLIGEYTAQMPSLIYEKITTNVGTMRNTGVEVTLGLNLGKRDFRYNATLAFAYEQNELTSLSNDDYAFTFEDRYLLPAPGHAGYLQRIEEGQPVGSFYGYVCNGINPDGTWDMEDLDGKPGLSADDRKYIGNGLPKYKVSLMNTFTYKNFDFSFLLRGMFDYDIFNEGRVYFGTQSAIDKYSTNVFKYALDEKVTADPLVSTYYLEKGDFLKIDNVTLGYTFHFKSEYVRNLRIYANVNNLATITGYKGLSPDINVTGLEAGIDRRSVYPITRTFSFGVKFGF